MKKISIEIDTETEGLNYKSEFGDYSKDEIRKMYEEAIEFENKKYDFEHIMIIDHIGLIKQNVNGATVDTKDLKQR